MDRLKYIVFVGVAFFLLFAGCGSDDSPPTDPGPTVPDGEADIAVAHTLAGPDGGDPVAGETLVSKIVITNDGDISSGEIVVTHPMIDRFDFFGATDHFEFISGAGHFSENPKMLDSITAEPVILDSAESETLLVYLEVPELFPNGWTRTVQVTVLHDDDDSSATAPENVSPAAASASIRNDGLNFSLLAPGVPEVYLAGEFNGWNSSDPDYLMYLDTEQREWGLTVPVSGTHQYKFVLKDPALSRQEWIADPKATRLNPDGYGGYNSVAGDPLPGPVSPLVGGIDPAKTVIYEMFTYDFSAAGDFASVAAGIQGDMQDLAGLGVNAIELLPVTGISPGFNWGYNPCHFFAVEPDYGTPEDFAQLVETAHNNGIAVILDMVFNHIGNGAPLEKIDDIGETGVFINYDQTTAEAFGMRDLNWYSTEMRQFFLDAALFWIEQYGIDGFRMDLVEPDDYAGYLWWSNELKDRHPEVFLIGEDYNFYNNSLTHAGMDAQWGGQHTDQWGGPANNFQQIVMAILEEDSYSSRWGADLGSFDTQDNPMWALANVLSWTEGHASPHNAIKYIVSHDERRVVYEVENAGSAEAALIGGAKKAKLGAATLLTAVGVPMIYMGEEIGEDDWVPQHPTPNKVDWADGDSGVRDYYKNMIALRLSHPSLADGGIDFHCPDWNTDQGTSQQEKTICYWRFQGSNPGNADIVIASNYDHADHDFTIDFPTSGTWYLLDPENGTAVDVQVEGNTLQTTLPASTARIYLKETSWLP